MRTFTVQELQDVSSQIFERAGASAEEASIVGNALVEANLVGHDSHGILRIPEYVRWMEQGLVTLGAHIKIVKESDSYAVVDGCWGFGQVVGREAMLIAIQKAEKVGVGTVFASQCCHLGRIGDYPLIAANRGLITIMFVNTHGAGKLVAPWGGRDRRLSANPISVGIPQKNKPPILVDISTSAIAEGKVRSMLYRKVAVPPGNIIDADGNPTTNAADFYGPPPGALLPFGGHKGYALGLVTDILAGALSGGGCSRKDTERVGNTFFAIVINVQKIRGYEPFYEDVEQLIQFVKSSTLAPGFDQILIPGEPEALAQTQRLKGGIPLDDETWQLIKEVGKKYGVTIPE